MDRNFENVGVQISAISENFSEEVNDDVAFYYLITTADVENVLDIQDFAGDKNINFGHYVPCYKINDDGTIQVKFEARIRFFRIFEFDIEVFMGNNEGINISDL